MDGTNGATMLCGHKGKVVVVMGATATGKSKLAVDLALRFGGEVVNSDKIQVHDGLGVVPNKVTAAESRGVPHHLIGGVSPDADYTAADFCRDATRAVESVHARGRVPIVAGGSNRYLEALLDGEPTFRRSYECCFLWVDADMPVLDRYIRSRVDCMLEHGLVDEVRGFFKPDADYSRGIRRAIGVPEMDTYFRLEAMGKLDGDDELRPGQHVQASAPAAAEDSPAPRYPRLQHPPPGRHCGAHVEDQRGQGPRNRASRVGGGRRGACREGSGHLPGWQW